MRLSKNKKIREIQESYIKYKVTFYDLKQWNVTDLEGEDYIFTFKRHS